jgi:hypothetical protein
MNNIESTPKMYTDNDLSDCEPLCLDFASLPQVKPRGPFTQYVAKTPKAEDSKIISVGSIKDIKFVRILVANKSFTLVKAE